MTSRSYNYQLLFFQSKLQNFEYAAEVLSELWSKVVIEGNSVVAEYIKEEPSDITITKSEEWKAIHVRESQYLLQIVKFTDQACCRPFESSYLKLIRNRFLPRPVTVIHNPDNGGIKWAKDDKEAKYLSLFQNLAFGANLLPEKVKKVFHTIIPARRQKRYFNDGYASNVVFILEA